MSRPGPPRIEGMCSLKVDNLTYRTTPDELRRVFQKYGDVGDVYIPRDRSSKSSRGFAFVRFYDKRDAEEAMDALDGKRLDGRELRVQMAKYGRPSPPRERGRRDRRRSRSRSRSRSRDRYSRRGRRDRRSRSRSNSRDASRSPKRESKRSRSRSRSRSPRDDKGDRRSLEADRKELGGKADGSPLRGSRSRSRSASRSRSRS